MLIVHPHGCQQRTKECLIGTVICGNLDTRRGAAVPPTEATTILKTNQQETDLAHQTCLREIQRLLLDILMEFLVRVLLVDHLWSLEYQETWDRILREIENSNRELIDHVWLWIIRDHLWMRYISTICYLISYIYICQERDQRATIWCADMLQYGHLSLERG